MMFLCYPNSVHHHLLHHVDSLWDLDNFVSNHFEKFSARDSFIFVWTFIRVGNYMGLVYVLHEICPTCAVEMSTVLHKFFCIVM